MIEAAVIRKAMKEKTAVYATFNGLLISSISDTLEYNNVILMSTIYLVINWIYSFKITEKFGCIKIIIEEVISWE